MVDEAAAEVMRVEAKSIDDISYGLGIVARLGRGTTATVTLEKSDPGFAITAVHLNVSARVPGADQQAFEKAANAAKSGCPVSKVLNAQITMEARLEG